MNERIRELYQRAHMIREYPTDDPMRGGNPPTVYWGGEESAKKFAEMLIKDCADWIRENYDSADAEVLAHYMEIYYGLHKGF